MSNQQTIVSFFIKDGANQLMGLVQSSLQKKKGKKRSLDEQTLPLQSSVVNFVQLPKRPLIPYFHHQFIGTLQGKNRQQIFHDKSQNDYLADISKFRLLYNKYLNLPKRNKLSNQLVKIDLNKFQRIQGLRLFENCCVDPSLQELLQKTSRQIEERNKQIAALTPLIIKQYSHGIAAKQAQIDHIIYCQEVSNKLHANKHQILEASQLIFEQIEYNQQQMKLRDRKKRQQWNHNFLTILNLKEMAEPTNIITPWPSNLLQKQKRQIISSQITGKILFQIEEKIRKAKQITNRLDFNYQYLFRRKNIGVHSFMNRQNNKYENKILNPPRQNFDIGPVKEKSQPIQSDNEQSNYLKMFQRLNNLKKKQELHHKNCLQRNKFIVPSERPIPIKRTNLPTMNSYHSFNIKPLKPSPLRLDDLEKYQYQPHKPPINIKRQSIPKKQTKKQSQYKQPIQTNDFPKKKLNFPIKIQHFEMASMEDSSLSYPIESINLKQLPLRFLKDRHKFKENRVKIEYPCRADPSTEQLLRKSMQVLNCLGAEVYCQQQVSYKTYHSVDQDDILAVSWLIQCPVKDVIKLYSQFFGKCPTKK